MMADTPDKYADLIARVIAEGPTKMHGANDIAALATMLYHEPSAFRDLFDIKLKGGAGAGKLEAAARKAMNKAEAATNEKKRKHEAMKKVEEAQERGVPVLDLELPQLTAEKFQAARRPNLLFNNGMWLDHRINRYVETENDGVKSALWGYLRNAIDAETGELLRTNTRVVNDVYEALKALVFRDRQDINPPSWLDENTADMSPRDVIACRNCLVHIPTETIMPNDPRFFTRNGLTFDYEDHWEGKPPSLWLTTLGQYFPGPLGWQSIQALQEWFGYLLTADTGLQKILILVGEAGSGKGTVMRILLDMLGMENVISPTLQNMASQFGMASLIGKQLMAITDMRLGKNSDLASIAQNMLRISGEDPMAIPRKNKDDWQGSLNVRIVIASNAMLSLPDDSGAFHRRLFPIVFEQDFTGAPDDKLTDKLRLELPGILRWAIEGRNRLTARRLGTLGGTFFMPDRSKAELLDNDIQTSPIRSFLAMWCERDARATVTKSQLFNAFEHWSNVVAFGSRYTDATFGKAMKTASGFKVGSTRHKDAPAEYTGVRLKPEYAEYATKPLGANGDF
jgi:putative DNA primase/helicase